MRKRRRLGRGAVLVEYSFLLVAFGIPVVIGIIAGGAQMYTNYQTAKTALKSPLP